jgi:[protein-PII] uridylyltransferase
MTPTLASDADRFAASMPARYRVLFDPRAVRKHAEIVMRRQGKPAHAEVWRTIPDGTTELCVVADDRPGLLLLIAAVLAAHHLDVMTGLLFSTSAGEVVDFFWVRRTGQDRSPLGHIESRSIAELLCDLITGAVPLDETPPPPRLPQADVRILGINDDGSAALSVETTDAPALLLTIARALFAQRVQIVRSLVRTVDRKVHNRFDILEIDGEPLSGDRLAAVRSAVASALRDP